MHWKKTKLLRVSFGEQIFYFYFFNNNYFYFCSKSKLMAKIPIKPHDEFFKATFGQLGIALDFLLQFFPPSIRNELDLKNLKRHNGSY
jgi:hypothetical protein